MPASTTRRLVRVLVAVCVALAAACVAALPTAADQPAWAPWQRIPGVVDVGARADGSLVVMAAGRLFSVSPSGAMNSFAQGSDGYVAGSADAESYFVLVPALTVDASACSFEDGDLFLLDLTSPPGIVRVDPAGHATRFTTLAGVDTLGGIAIDTTGGFGHRLLVTGTHANQTTVFAIDCQARARR